jgi:hypothetical protein
MTSSRTYEVGEKLNIKEGLSLRVIYGVRKGGKIGFYEVVN